jgi:hypothetical protein
MGGFAIGGTTAWGILSELTLVPQTAPLLPLPERTKRAVPAVRNIQARFVEALHVALAHRHRFGPVLEEEILQFLMDLSCYVRLSPLSPGIIG